MTDKDITVIPPPCMTHTRALEIYLDPFKRAIEYTNLCNVSGDITEFGTFNGFTARIFSEWMRVYRDKRKLWLYDSWEGFPDSTQHPIDGECKEVLEGYWKLGDCSPKLGAQTPSEIKRILNEIIPNQVETIQGFYKDTLSPSTLPKSISILHIDCDLYESAEFAIQGTRDLLAEGAVILFDDFNNNLASNKFGERKAFIDTIKDKCESWFTYGWSGYAFIYHKE